MFIKPTKEASALKESLEKHGLRVLAEVDDGHKHIDLSIPSARINIEVDGSQHLTDPNQIITDIKRAHYSENLGYDTIRVPNQSIHSNLEGVSKAIAEAAKNREKTMTHSDIELYEKSANLYEELQHKRPDYVGAKEAFKEFALNILSGKGELAIADFCCGTGKNSKMLSERLPVSKVTLVDINRQFLDIALNSGFRVPTEVICSDILLAHLKPEHDVVISMFAYHHVKDESKQAYIEKVQGAFKKDGILILGEIYTPNKETTIRYYVHLLNAIDSTVRTPELEKFLKETGDSDNFEYKVSREFAHNQLKKSGFKLLNEKKIWPTDGSFPENVGTFVEVWKFTGI